MHSIEQIYASHQLHKQQVDSVFTFEDGGRRSVCMCVNSVVNADRGGLLEGPVRTTLQSRKHSTTHYQCLRGLTG